MNVIFKYLHNEKRSLLWLTDELNLSYQRLYRMKDCTNSELAEKLTFEEVNKLETIIENIKGELK